MKKLNTTNLIKLHIPKILISEVFRVVDCLNKIQMSKDDYTNQITKLQTFKLGVMQALLCGRKQVNHLIKEKESV